MTPTGHEDAEPARPPAPDGTPLADSPDAPTESSERGSGAGVSGRTGGAAASAAVPVQRGESDDASGTAQEVRRTRPTAGRRRLFGALSVVGELMITVGVVLALFVAYSLWWTNVLADRESHKQSDTVRRHWAQVAPSGPGALDTKDGIGFLHVPSMKNGEVLVRKGTGVPVLNEGVAGYYTKPVKSALPQDKEGNFALAAHRDGHGAKFHNIDKVRDGDPIVFETRDTWYVYKVFKILPQTSKYDTSVLKKVPKESGKRKPGRYITLTTCTPVYTSLYRYVVWGELVRTQKVDAARTPPKELTEAH